MPSHHPIPEEYTDGYVLFMGKRFTVDSRALIPRLETEELVKYCLKLLRDNPDIHTIADIGTGSGIIPISIVAKTERPLRVIATDMSQDALDLARENAAPFLKGDVTEGQGDFASANSQSHRVFLLENKTPFVKGEGNIDGDEGDFQNPQSSQSSDSSFAKELQTHIHYRPDLIEKARELRKNMTGPEKKIWYSILRKNTFQKFKFLRQKPLLDYIVDFYCHELGLVIEIDGFSHYGNEPYDQKRTTDLEKYRITVVRFSNDEVLYSFDSVCRKLEKIVECIKNKFQEISITEYKHIGDIINPPSLLRRDTSFAKEVRDQIHFLRGDLLTPIITHFGKNSPDEILITANLPYVREKEIAGELLHEPRMAFLGGVQTGFELYERFFEQLNIWKNRPKTCHIVIEFGLWQRDIAETVIQHYGWQYHFFADLRGIERFCEVILES